MNAICRERIWDSSLWVRSRMGVPSRRYSPRVGTSRQPRMFIIVDLPEPEVPMMATNSPWSMLSVTPSSALTWFSCPSA
ncbi:Uncharacterised protein [Flavonifractor plautii]|uniref:Uncharacterized protein n=1 Tax=Flavonifractor plautii TaxID=292800 RepID=A0A174W7X0_FLAPL|nr:Uncharacterised protein [Flavonifractor plautii]